MDLPLAKLDQFGAEALDVPGGYKIAVAGQEYGIFPLPEDPAQLTSKYADLAGTPEQSAQMALATFAQFKATEHRIRSDRRLSDEGRTQELAKPTETLLQGLLAAHLMIGSGAKGFETVEAQRYQTPRPPDTPVGELRAREVRDWMRSMPHADQLKLMQNMQDGSDSMLLRAVLHSPVPFAELEKYAKEAWRERVDREDPVGLELIQLAHRSLDWAKRTVLIAQSQVVPQLKLPTDRIVEYVGMKSAQDFFGASPHDIAMYQRRTLAAARR